MELRQLITEYLDEAKMMQLATVRDDRPWVCNVWFAADPDLNIYWFSSTTRRHSHEVAANSHVAASICLPHTPADKFARAIQLEGTAEQLSSPVEVAKAMKYYVGRIFELSQVKNFMSNLDKPHRFYRIKPTTIVLFDTKNFPQDARQELHLPS